jgi:hypothetical protein
MLLIQAAEFQAKEMARLCNTPAYLCSLDIGSYAYTSSAESRMDLWTFGVRAYADCIAATLSMNNVLPNGTYVEFDSEAYILGNYAMQDSNDTTNELNEVGSNL